MQNRIANVFRTMAKTLLLLSALLFISSYQATAENTAHANNQRLSQKLYVVGHRGAAGLAPENTMAAFARALEIGVDAMELDVLLTADNEIVVHHDYRLKPEITRTPDGEWLGKHSRPAVNRLTLAELKTYDVGRLKSFTRYSFRYPSQKPVDGERIPTLREVITLLKNEKPAKTELWIEIKTSPQKPEMTPRPETVADAVVKTLRQEKAAHRARILSFDWRSLAQVQKSAPDIPTVYLSTTSARSNTIQRDRLGPSPWTAGLDVDDFNGSIPRIVKAAGGRFWAPRYNQITWKSVQEAHQFGIQVFVWTPDSRSKMEYLIDMGVDGIITNRPDILREVLSER